MKKAKKAVKRSAKKTTSSKRCPRPSRRAGCRCLLGAGHTGAHKCKLTGTGVGMHWCGLKKVSKPARKVARKK